MVDAEAGGIAADALKSFIERIERLEEERKKLSLMILRTFTLKQNQQALMQK